MWQSTTRPSHFKLIKQRFSRSAVMVRPRVTGQRHAAFKMDPGKAIEFINKNEAFYGAATILGKPYLTGYEPMHDASNQVIGIYYFGYMVSGSLTSP